MKRSGILAEVYEEGLNIGRCLWRGLEYWQRYMKRTGILAEVYEEDWNIGRGLWRGLEYWQRSMKRTWILADVYEEDLNIGRCLWRGLEYWQRSMKRNGTLKEGLSKEFIVPQGPLLKAMQNIRKGRRVERIIDRSIYHGFLRIWKISKCLAVYKSTVFGRILTATCKICKSLPTRT